MLDSLFDLVKSVFSLFIRRTFGSLKVEIQHARVAGEQEKPVLAITITIENPQSQNAFVRRFEVMMLEPFRGSAVRYEFRRAGAEGNVESVPINIPGHGISKALTVLAYFDKDMSSLNKHYKAKIAAIGRARFRKRYTEFGGECPW